MERARDAKNNSGQLSVTLANFEVKGMILESL